MEKLISSLSQIERAVIPHLNKSIEEIMIKTSLDKTTVIRALTFLENKEIVKLHQKVNKIADLGVNGVYYKKNHLPERRLLITIENHNNKTLEEIKEKADLSDNEFKAAIGVLKRKLLIDLESGRLKLTASKEECSKVFPEEIIIKRLPLPLDNLSKEDLATIQNLKSRKDIVEIVEAKEVSFVVTEKGKELEGRSINLDLIEEVTPELIKEGVKNRKFRRYDFSIKMPSIYGGKKHFVNQSVEQGKKI